VAFSTAGSGPSRPQINVTPLIDVLLVLIIVFMIVVSQEQTTGERAQIPQPAHDQVDSPQRTIVIQVAWSGKDQPPHAPDQSGGCGLG
jgi:biopolymer transport protein TolR